MDSLDDNSASWCKRRTLSASSAVAVKARAGSTVELSIVTGPGGCCIRVRDDGKTLLKDKAVIYKDMLLVEQT